MLAPVSEVRGKYARLIEGTAIPEEAVLEEALEWLAFINLQCPE